jgi:hypothetical protein
LTRNTGIVSLYLRRPEGLTLECQRLQLIS